MKSRVLVIDDERVFPIEAEYVRTVDDAIQYLTRWSWDVVWFDHDLGDKFGRDTMTVLRTLMHEGEIPSIKVAYVHSMNPVGAGNLVNALTDMGIRASRVPLPEGHTVIKLDLSCPGCGNIHCLDCRDEA